MKYLALNDDLYRYICANRTGATDPVLDELRRETETLGDDSQMQISREQGSFLTLLTAAISARTTIEVGTFTGYSSICIARGLPENGRLICLDQSQEWTDVARRYWAKAGVADRIELRLGAAAATLRNLESSFAFDLAFIDADKSGYDTYFELILPRMKQNGVILFDNMLRGGRLGAKPPSDPDDRAIDALNHKLAKDKRVDTVLLSIADGIQFCRKK